MKMVIDIDEKAYEVCRLTKNLPYKAMADLPHEYKTKEQRARTGGIAACQVIISDLPSVTPARAKGNFTRQELEDWLYVKCSECGCCNGIDDSDFCPYCGADMRGGE